MTALQLSFFLFSAILPFLSRKLALSISFYDRPKPPFKSHKRPVPYVGGIGLLLLLAIYTILLYVIHPTSFLLIPLLIVFSFTLLGLLDDLFTLSYQTRLASELLLFFLLAFYRTSSLPLSILLSVVFSAVLNAFNFIDIKDSLATSYSISLLFTFLFFSISLTIDPALLAILISYIIFLISFLYLNAEPSKAYLGDGGKYSISSFLCLLLLYTSPSYQLLSLFSPASLSPSHLGYSLIIVSFIPLLFELFFTSTIRLKKGLSPFHASPDHIPSRLSARGLSTFKITLVFLILPLIAVFHLVFVLQLLVPFYLLLLLAFLSLFVYKYFRLM